VEIHVIAHCLLNSLTRVKGIRHPEPYNTENKKIIQLPCPEIIYFGIDRLKNTKDKMDTPDFRQFCRELFLPYADMIEMFAKDGHTVIIAGVSNSPSCAAPAVFSDSAVCDSQAACAGGESCQSVSLKDGAEEEKGIFIEEIEAELNRRRVLFCFV